MSVNYYLQKRTKGGNLNEVPLFFFNRLILYAINFYQAPQFSTLKRSRIASNPFGV